jgi:hypothetical protein
VRGRQFSKYTGQVRVSNVKNVKKHAPQMKQNLMMEKRNVTYVAGAWKSVRLQGPLDINGEWRMNKIRIGFKTHYHGGLYGGI